MEFVHFSIGTINVILLIDTIVENYLIIIFIIINNVELTINSLILDIIIIIILIKIQ
jgi:hypothetical protein